MGQITKHCAHCRQDKPVTEFYRDKHTRDGLQSWCKECSNSRSGNRCAKVADIDWEQRRYEIVKEMLPSAAVAVNASRREWMEGMSFQEASAVLAVKYADALIEILKRQEP